MTPGDLKLDQDLYRFDGRLYELSITENVLLLRLRGSVVRERIIAAAALFSAVIGLLLLGSVSVTPWPFFHLTYERNLLFPAGLIFMVCIATTWIKLLNTDEIWEFQKYHGRMHCRRNSNVSIPLPSVHSLKAWQHHDKYFLRVQVEGWKPLQLGNFGFSVRERAWQDDAELIAKFLDVPLEYV